jgi:hypothetical protein
LSLAAWKQFLRVAKLLAGKTKRQGLDPVRAADRLDAGRDQAGRDVERPVRRNDFGVGRQERRSFLDILGLAVVALGGGRVRPQDAIDFAVGLTGLVELGDKIDAGQPLAMVHARTQEAAEQAVRQAQAAYRIAADAPAAQPMIYKTIRP